MPLHGFLTRDKTLSMPKSILFVCVGNACRSQIAEGFARHGGGKSIQAYSAGSQAAGFVAPLAIQVMLEKGIDISEQYSKGIRELPISSFDYVVTVCGHADEHCPVFPGQTKVVHIGFDDPPKLAQNARNDEEALGHYRRVRDEIRQFIASLPAALCPQASRR